MPTGVLSLGFSDAPRAPRAPFDLESLARALAAADPRFVVWKGGSNLDAQGDLDAAAPRSAWAVLANAFESWVGEHGLEATITCDHPSGMVMLVGCGGTAGRNLLQVDLIDQKLVHGAAAWAADNLREVALDCGGFRCLGAGAEGVARALATRHDREAERLVLSDPIGARALSGELGLRGVLATRTDRASRLALSAVLVARALASPASVRRSVRSDAATRRCPVIEALKAGRRLPEALESWLDAVSRDHEVRRA